MPDYHLAEKFYEAWSKFQGDKAANGSAIPPFEKLTQGQKDACLAGVQAAVAHDREERLERIRR